MSQLSRALMYTSSSFKRFSRTEFPASTQSPGVLPYIDTTYWLFLNSSSHTCWSLLVTAQKWKAYSPASVQINFPSDENMALIFVMVLSKVSISPCVIWRSVIRPLVKATIGGLESMRSPTIHTANYKNFLVLRYVHMYLRRLFYYYRKIIFYFKNKFWLFLKIYIPICVVFSFNYPPYQIYNYVTRSDVEGYYLQ